MTQLETTQRDDAAAPLAGPGERGLLRQALIAAASLAAVALVLVVVLSVAGVSSLAAAQSVWTSTFGSRRSFGETLIRATPLLVIALTLLPSLRAGLYNVGAPGQLAMGALAVTAFALQTPDLPRWLAIPLCIAVAGAAGAGVAAVPGALKAWFGVNEIITTLAMNFVSLAVVGWLLNGPMKSGFGNLPQSDEIPANATIPILIPGTRAHIGILVALAFVPLIWSLDRSRLGYRLQVFGANPQLHRQTGISRRRYLTGLMAFGGFGAGLAGWMQVAAIDERLYASVAAPVGYAGLFVALLGALSPLGIIAAAFVLGGLLSGGDGLQVGANVSPEIIQVVLGLILLAYAVTRTAPAASSTTTTRRRRWTL